LCSKPMYFETCMRDRGCAYPVSCMSFFRACQLTEPAHAVLVSARARVQMEVVPEAGLSTGAEGRAWAATANLPIAVTQKMGPPGPDSEAPGRPLCRRCWEQGCRLAQRAARGRRRCWRWRGRCTRGTPTSLQRWPRRWRAACRRTAAATPRVQARKLSMMLQVEPQPARQHIARTGKAVSNS